MQLKINQIIVGAIIVVVLLNGGVAYYLIQNQNKRLAFVINQKLFNEFAGKKALEIKLNELRKRNNFTVDSLWQLTRQSNSLDERQSYEERIERIKLMEEELAAKYTSDIWQRINGWVSEYAKINNYDFVLGAAGNGSLMYGGADKDITDDVILFVNKKYQGD